LVLLLGQPAGQYRKPSKQARPSVVQLVQFRHGKPS
jgi:hypothetical protein